MITDRTDFPVCPYCGHVEKDALEINLGPGLEGDGETTCGSCGEEYRISRHVSISYSTNCMLSAAFQLGDQQ